ncbi:MAG: sodium:solute symporter family protein [Myxococcales bacterium]|nr:sodium:solute symporter family protein [Myxococcales bacterium]
MSLEEGIVAAYLAACVAIGLIAARRVLTSNDEYWVAGRRIGPGVNAIAIMATLASGGSIVGVMGLAYARGLPATLALFAGAVVGFPLAALLVARPLRNFGRYTITDFLAWRFPAPIVRLGVPVLIVVAFTIYVVAQLKAAGVTAQVLLGWDYDTALWVSTLVFVAYVSVGGMLAITWTDVVQGALMMLLVLGAAALLLADEGGLALTRAATQAPALGAAGGGALATQLGSFVIWAAAIPVIPHVVMRVYTARDARGARLSLNLAMVAYSVIILAAVLVIVPIGRLEFPALTDADSVFHRVIEAHFPPLVRGLAVAAVIAAVMSTTDALLLACSSAIAHDLIEQHTRRPLSAKALGRINVAVVWLVGAVAMWLARDPPALLTELYSAAVGVLAAGLFIPLVAGIWWRRANRLGGAAAFATGAGVYLALQLGGGDLVPPLSAILFALPASALAMWIGGRLGAPERDATLAAVEALHRD